MTAGPRILALIPARGSSKDGPRRNLRQIGDRPLLSWTLETALAARHLFARIVVSTDELEIAKLARAMGVEVPFRRPNELAGDDVPILPVLRHAVSWLESKGEARFDWICWLSPTAPLRSVEDLERAISLVQQGKKPDSVLSAIAVAPSIPNGKVGYRRSDALLLVSRDVLMERGSLWGDVVRPLPMPAERALDASNENDLQQIELLVSGKEPAPRQAQPAQAQPAQAQPMQAQPMQAQPLQPMPPAQPEEELAPTAQPEERELAREDLPELDWPVDSEVWLRWLARISLGLSLASSLYFGTFVHGLIQKDRASLAALNPSLLPVYLVLTGIAWTTFFGSLSEFATWVGSATANLRWLGRSSVPSAAEGVKTFLLRPYLTLRALFTDSNPDTTTISTNRTLTFIGDATLWLVAVFLAWTIFHIQPEASRETHSVNTNFANILLTIFFAQVTIAILSFAMLLFESKVGRRIRQCHAILDLSDDRPAGARPLSPPWGARHAFRTFFLAMTLTAAGLFCLVGGQEVTRKAYPYLIGQLALAGALIAIAERKPLLEKLPRGRLGRQITGSAMLAGLPLFSMPLMNLLVAKSSSLPPKGETLHLLVLLLLLVAPWLEELFFRGILFDALRQRLSPAAAVLVSALLFALSHDLLLQQAHTFGLGLLCGIARVATGRLWAPILVHFLNNAAAVFLGQDQGSIGLHPAMSALGFLLVAGGLALLRQDLGAASKKTPALFAAGSSREGRKERQLWYFLLLYVSLVPVYLLHRSIRAKGDLNESLSLVTLVLVATLIWLYFRWRHSLQREGLTPPSRLVDGLLVLVGIYLTLALDFKWLVLRQLANPLRKLMPGNKITLVYLALATLVALLLLQANKQRSSAIGATHGN